MIPERARGIARFLLAIDLQSGVKVSPQFAWVPDSALATEVHGLSIDISIRKIAERRRSRNRRNAAVQRPAQFFLESNLPAKRQAGPFRGEFLKTEESYRRPANTKASVTFACIKKGLIGIQGCAQALIRQKVFKIGDRLNKTFLELRPRSPGQLFAGLGNVRTPLARVVLRKWLVDDLGR